ncbi:unnamed protein product [Phytophthora fragariaefolia]|uniref:Unnamed protein product n=1 Tax=Phytophthora fragariaefolia TaxID=1490495 RepID=A0A9W6TU49_9STRA|nr:unnamed protein product [Phytophthora fragariaefolia]
MDPHAMGLQGGGGMSLPMSMGLQGGANPQTAAMGLGLGAVYAPQQQQQMMMNMAPQPQPQQMPMGSVGMAQMSAAADWRIQLTREHRANLIAKIYNEMVRVSADPVPGIKLWMNVSWYELSLYKESPTQEAYINKIFTRLKSLRAQQSDMNAAMAAQALPNQGMLSRLDFSYYNTLNLGQRGAANGQVNSYPGHSQFSGPGPHPGVQQQQQQQQQQQAKPMSATSTPVKSEANMSSNSAAEYWQQHAALRAKHQGDVEKVHSAFKKYVDHMKGHDETEQKKKLRYLLSYVELCANILSEDKTTHPARKIEELDKVFKYIVKIVNPYLKKLRTETDKRGSYPSADGNISGQPSASIGPGVSMSSGASTSSGSSTMPATTSSGYSNAMTQSQPTSQSQQQSSVNTSAAMQQTPQQKQQQHYLMQQRAQQMQQQQQQQQMQAQARQQQMMQQQMMRQQQIQQKSAQQQFSAQQANQTNHQQQNSQNAANQQSGQQTQQQLGQQVPSRSQQGQTQQQRPPQLPQKPQQPTSQPQQNQQPPTSRGESTSISSGLSLGLDDSLYGSMGSDLLQMPTPSGTSSGLMDFSSALSPTSFGGMDLLDWDDSAAGQGTSDNSGASGGDSADLMTFVETL